MKNLNKIKKIIQMNSLQGNKPNTLTKIVKKVIPHYDNPKETKLGYNTETHEEVWFHHTHRRTAHTQVVGSTRYGKSNLYLYCILQEIRKKEAGLCVIDPHGELIKDILKHLCIIPDIADRVIIFDPSDLILDSLGYSPIPKLAHIKSITSAASGIIDAIFTVWNQTDYENPTISSYLSDIFYMIVKFQLNMYDARKIIFKPVFRYSLLDRLDRNIQREDVILDNFEKFNLLKGQALQKEQEGIKNRLTPFVENEKLQEVLTKKVGLNFKEAMDNKKIVLINLHGGGYFQSKQRRLLGNLFINDIVRTGFGRDDDELSNLPNFYVYVDEIGEMPTSVLSEGLMGLAKRKVLFTVAYQEPSSIKILDEHGQPKFYENVMENMRNKFFFGSPQWETASIYAHQMPELLETIPFKEIRWNFKQKKVPDMTPRVQEVVKNTFSVSMEQSKQERQSIQKSFGIRVSKQSGSSFQLDTTQSKSQALEMVNVLSSTSQYSTRESVLNALSMIRAKSVSNSFTQSETNQITHALTSSVTNTETEQQRKSIAQTVSQSRSRMNEHVEGRLLADIVTKMDSQENRDTQVQQVQKAIENAEMEARAESRSNGTTNIRSKSEEDYSSVVDSQSNENTDTQRQGSSQTQTHTNSSFQEWNSQYEFDSPINQNASSRFGMRNMHQDSMAYQNSQGTEQSHRSSRSHSVSDGQKSSTSSSEQVSDSMANTIQNAVNKVNRKVQSDSDSQSSANVSASSWSQQQNNQSSNSVKEGLTNIVQKQQQEVSEKIQSVARSEIQQSQEARSINKVLAKTEQNITTDQNTNTFSSEVAKAVSELESLQSKQSRSFLLQFSIKELKSKSEQFSEDTGLKTSQDIAHAQKRSQASGVNVEWSYTEEYKEITVDYYEKEEIEYTQQEKWDLITAKIMRQDQGHAYVQRFKEKAVPVKIDFVEKPKMPKEELKVKVQEFKQAVVAAHPDLYQSAIEHTPSQKNGRDDSDNHFPGDDLVNV